MPNYNPSILSVDLEFTNLCEINCNICPRGSITRCRGFLSSELLRIFIDKFNKTKPLVSISGMGDPLLNPYFADFINILKRNGFKTGVVINIASLIKRFDDTCEKIMEGSPHQITLSIPSIESETISRIYGKDIKIYEIKETLKKFLDLCKGRSRLRVSGIITALNESKEDYKNFFKELKIPVFINRIHSRGSNLKYPELLRNSPIGEKNGCNLFLFHTFIAQNGDVLACCHDLTGETAFAHISEGTEKILEKKKDIIKKLPFFSLCNRCDEPLRFIELPEDYDKLPITKLFKRLKIYRG